MNPIELSGALADAVETAERSVVRLQGRGRPVSGTVFSEKGHVVAISHTIDGNEVDVGLPDGRSVSARVIGRDPATDLALLEAEVSGLVPPSWADLADARVGELVLGVYRPGRTARASCGVLAALGDAWRTRFGGRVDRYVEASLPLQPGFSGGLLVSPFRGALAVSASGIVRGVPLGLPAATVRRVAEALLSSGRVRRGYLGVGSYPVALPPGLQSSLGQATALLVVSVQPESPADGAGLLLGDVLVGVDGRPVAEPADLLPSLDEERVGRDLVLRIVRGGEVREVRVTVGERGASS
jgi:S1-C subfamily serine protease